MTPSPARLQILRDLAPGNLVQPATALWRVYEIEAVHRHVSFVGRVLDLGCGDGSLARVVFGPSTPGRSLVGLELDPTDADAARASGVYDLVHTAPGGAMPEPDGSFDMVFSNSVLEHIPDIEPVLSEAGRVLRPGGSFVFTVPSEHFHACLGPDTLPARWFRRPGEASTDVIDLRLAHQRYWSDADWTQHLAAYGMKVVDVVRYFPEPAVTAWRRTSDWTGGIAFELYGRKSPTRKVQRKMGLTRLDTLLPDSARASLLAAVLRRHLSYPADVDATRSGGLLIRAVKA